MRTLCWMGFMEHLNGCLHVIITMWKIFPCFSTIFLFSCNTGVRQFLCFHQVFMETFTCFGFDVLQLFLTFLGISIFFLLIRKIYFLNHFIPSINLKWILMVYFPYNNIIRLKLAMENLTGCLHIKTSTWKPNLV